MSSIPDTIQDKPRMKNLLPAELIGRIYQYDSTFHEVFQNCMDHVRLCRARKIRLEREIKRLRHEPGVVVLEGWEPFQVRVQIEYHEKIYSLSIPFDYPFEQPVVSHAGQKFRPFDCWSPATCLLMVLVTYDMEGSSGKELC